ncbi:putative phosphatidylinositol 3-kinase [Sesbania bispinosa]|nr:putative phosphatidylinositol 3-kinase [Sesbania bispinosa]
MADGMNIHTELQNCHNLSALFNGDSLVLLGHFHEIFLINEGVSAAIPFMKRHSFSSSASTSGDPVPLDY